MFFFYRRGTDGKPHPVRQLHKPNSYPTEKYDKHGESVRDAVMGKVYELADDTDLTCSLDELVRRYPLVV